ncbi:Uncharacterized protein LSUB1_G002062 [Lachnellula subtilissima]|uniref:Cyclin-D1-binding protein 1-like N-terminal domain-containing protein n=1 Tax=Lachnellula subtilissima TaxID=602034 RepID=A0A8H8S0N2_9HELO|nr:Uncharacterized protein LSUB1_G002062 [Lachnellula subtilissima]
MASSKIKSEQNLASLKSTVETTSALLTQLQSSSTPKDSDRNSNINALDLAHDTASLIRAHSTKLSLLIINKPFTASAISTVLRELVSGPLPGLASAVELCNAAKYTKAMSAELQWRAKKVFMELGTLVKAIPLDGKTLSEDLKNGTGKTGGKGSMASTGVLWEACDGVAELKKLGIAGLMIKKADEYRDLLKDALEELQEWGEESDGSDDEDETAGEQETETDGVDTSAQDAVDSIFASQRHISSEDPDKIRPRLDSAQKRLRLVILMYQAVIKRRFKTLPHLPHPEIEAKPDQDTGIINCVDEVMDVFKKIPDITDELASAFYELDGVGIDKRMDECFFTGFAASELLVKNWEGKEDEFTVWARKFQVAMKKGWQDLP